MPVADYRIHALEQAVQGIHAKILVICEEMSLLGNLIRELEYKTR